MLWLAYHFPPTAGAGVQRSVKFVRYLGELGYEPIVVTGSGEAQGRWTPRDETLADQLPAGLRVIRVPGPEPPPASPWRRRLERWLGLEPAFSRWWVDGAVKAGAAAGDADLVYATMAPYETGAAAGRLAALSSRPWVADLRDPWALDEMLVYPSGLHRRLALRRMGSVLGSASAIVMNTDEAARTLVRRFPALRDRPVVAIPNGFDNGDFDGAPRRRRDPAFRIVHAGYLHTELGQRERRRARLRRLLGGAEAEVDILTRSHLLLLEAGDRVLRGRPDLRRSVELHLAGVLSDGDRSLLEAHELPVHAHGYLPHGDSVALLESADLLFLPMHDLPPGRRARIVPGKTYEYLASGRPILAAVPDGDARDLLEAAETATVCRPSDVDSIAAAMARQLARFCADGPVPSHRPRVADAFERRGLTAQLADLFDNALREAGGPHPGGEPASRTGQD